MKALIRVLFLNISFFISILFSSIVVADIAVFVHGYHGAGNTWRHHGIIPLLETKGWKDAGHYVPFGGHVPIPGLYPSSTDKQMITVNLPSEAPIDIQAAYLDNFLAYLAVKFPDKMIHLIGHSAGGIVARLTIVKNPKLPVIQLITIASPHLGTPIAEFADFISDSPASIFAPFVRLDQINRAERLYEQLSREKENFFLFYLNCSLG
jgi:triacylglycerol lipase